MAYFIFLKYLRSLEEFSKNPHVKIPPKSPCANFQSLGIFKNQILFRKEFSSQSPQPAQQPAGPSELSAQPRPTSSFLPDRPLFPPTGPWPLSRPSRPTRQWRPTRLPPSSRGSASSHAAFAPLRTRLTGGPHPSSLTFGFARVQPCLPALHLGMPPEKLPPRHHSPLILPPS
jgi:hypothetical protein